MISVQEFWEETMQDRVRKLLYALILIILPAAFGAQDEAPPRRLQSVAPVFSQSSMNVFRRYEVKPEVMYEFYGKVLGLKQLTTFNVGGSTGVARFEAGASQVKLTGRVPNRKYAPGNVQDATGLRLLTFFFPNQREVIERFKSQGLPAPEFQPLPDNQSSALVKDPDGQWVQLIAAPGESASFYDQIEIGLTVSDLDVSRKFYGGFVGLEELPVVEDPIFHTKKYPFRHGSTIVSLRSFGTNLPADTGSGGIQYVVSDIRAVEALAKARKITIDQPLSILPGFGLKTIWLDDPDGITNYFAEVGVSSKPPRKQ
jgi:catechol 2,3-dioxygenase-like lactoylglutathione lyase family enzyme